MYKPTEISLSQYTWATWKREAVAARARSKRTAWFAFGVVTIALSLAGLANVEGSWRYSVLVYAPVAGLIVLEPTRRLAMRRMFRATGAAMRYRLVPALVPHASDAELAELAARNSVTIGSRALRAVDTGKAVVVSVGPSSTAWTDGGVVVADTDGGGYSSGGDGGGGFGGGGGDGGGGG